MSNNVGRNLRIRLKRTSVRINSNLKSSRRLLLLKQIMSMTVLLRVIIPFGIEEKYYKNKYRK